MTEWEKVNEKLQEVSKDRDNLFLENEELKSRLSQLDDLLNAVDSKFPNESSFQTAYRYIRMAEMSSALGSSE